MKCIFCELSDIKLREIIVASDETARAFLTNIPITPGHALIAPTRHVANFEELTETEVHSILRLHKIISGALRKTFGAEGFNCAWNEGAAAGQSVPHFHLHVVPRKKGDSGITEYDPRKFLYRPGSRAETPEQELREVAKQIRGSLDFK